jgi:hypothetical protein
MCKVKQVGTSQPNVFYSFEKQKSNLQARIKAREEKGRNIEFFDILLWNRK